MSSEIVARCTGFQWDEGNQEKNWYLHQVNNSECEEIFFNVPLIIGPDVKHSDTESRFYAFGRTDKDRWLFIAFTIRGTEIRVISARDMNQKESRAYAKRV